MDSLVGTWVDGWVVSRGAAPPRVEPWGWTIDMGQAEHVSRHVLAATGDAVEEATVREVADAVTGAGVWLKVFDDPARVGGWLGPGWWIDPEPGYLMTCRVPEGTPAAPAVPEGFRLRVWTRAGVTRVLLAAPDGSLAARGQLAVGGATGARGQFADGGVTGARGQHTHSGMTTGHGQLTDGGATGARGQFADGGVTGVVDQIETAPAHRRKGLGSHVMSVLHGRAAEQGVGTLVLAGTPAGRALYEHLGWRTEAPLTSAKFTGGGAWDTAPGRRTPTAHR
ncbi:GNAT family N-acetyltransferase [Streptomyces sp. NPDC006997]|uniref:GNAT family N-acetyltransferase n=1 Tax=Streptomyces sp. NPDC006997 TaxID=3155356 RepID=UPI0033F664F3